MQFMTWIIEQLNAVSAWFYSLYLECYDKPWPVYLLANWFYSLCSGFNNLAWYFYYFNNWVVDTANKVASILSWSTIWSYILSYVPNLLQVRDWFYYWWSNTWNVVVSWWSTTQVTVQGWVQDAKDFATSLFNQLNSWLASLQSAWDNFKGRIPTIDEIISWWGNWWGNILGQLGTWWNSRLLDVQNLINSTLKTWFPFYDDLVKLWSSIAAFFTNPLEYLWQRFADWFLGPET